MIALLILFSIILIAAPVYAENSDLNTTFTDLDSAVNIDDITSVELTENYTFNPETDGKFSYGVEISKNMTITGKDTYIDGAGQARLMHIKSYCNVVIENITFKNGYSNTSGAGIYLDSYSNLTLVNCAFEANTVYNSNGGGINSGNNTNIEIRK